MVNNLYQKSPWFINNAFRQVFSFCIIRWELDDRKWCDIFYSLVKFVYKPKGLHNSNKNNLVTEEAMVSRKIKSPPKPNILNQHLDFKLEIFFFSFWNFFQFSCNHLTKMVITRKPGFSFRWCLQRVKIWNLVCNGLINFYNRFFKIRFWILLWWNVCRRGAIADVIPFQWWSKMWCWTFCSNVIFQPHKWNVPKPTWFERFFRCCSWFRLTFHVFAILFPKVGFQI